MSRIDINESDIVYVAKSPSHGYQDYYHIRPDCRAFNESTTIVEREFKHIQEWKDPCGYCAAEGAPETVEDDPDELRRMRVDERLSLREIGDRIGLSHQGVKNRLEKHDIEG